ncbi:IclR family transcriptional regulator [Megalodesulfovibrio paquesii]
MDDPKHTDQVPALARALAILDFVGHKPGATFTLIHTGLGLPKSSVHMLLKTLVAQGILRISTDGGYTLGLRLFELGALAVSRLDVRKEALPLMQRLVEKVQLTCHLGILEGMESVYLAKVECKQAVIVNSWEGKRVSLSTSALGKSLLLGATPQLFEEIVQAMPLTIRTPNSISSREAFAAHLQEARRKGWTIDDEEDVPGIRCVGAPVFGLEGQPVSLSVSGPTNQVPYHRLEELAASVMETARQLSHLFGVRSAPQGGA